MTEPSRPDSHERNGQHLACRFHPTLPQVSYNFFKAAGYETDRAQQALGGTLVFENGRGDPPNCPAIPETGYTASTSGLPSVADAQTPANNETFGHTPGQHPTSATGVYLGLGFSCDDAGNATTDCRSGIGYGKTDNSAERRTALSGGGVADAACLWDAMRRQAVRTLIPLGVTGRSILWRVVGGFCPLGPGGR